MKSTTHPCRVPHDYPQTETETCLLSRKLEKNEVEDGITHSHAIDDGDNEDSGENDDN